MILNKTKIDKSWTLFLDRDGVINEKLNDDYVKDLSEFRFLPGALDALKVFSELFGRIIVVTNQQGIGKALMSEDELEIIHTYLIKEVGDHGGFINKIYHSPYLAEESHITRKPNTGLAIEAKHDFPGIDFAKSFMVGDSASDLEFGRNLNMANVLISGDKIIISSNKDMFDLNFRSLFEFSQYLCR